MRKVKHYAGYGTVMMGKVNDGAARLHVRVEGNHEQGLRPYYCIDEYFLFRWIVSRFDKSVPDAVAFLRMHPTVRTEDGYIQRDGLSVETCDYYIDWEG